MNKLSVACMTMFATLFFTTKSLGGDGVDLHEELFKAQRARKKSGLADQPQDEAILTAYADDLERALKPHHKGKTRGRAYFGTIRDAAHTFVLAYDLHAKKKPWYEIYLEAHPRVERSLCFTGGIAAGCGLMWFKRVMDL